MQFCNKHGIAPDCLSSKNSGEIATLMVAVDPKLAQAAALQYTRLEFELVEDKWREVLQSDEAHKSLERFSKMVWWASIPVSFVLSVVVAGLGFLGFKEYKGFEDLRQKAEIIEKKAESAETSSEAFQLGSAVAFQTITNSLHTVSNQLAVVSETASNEIYGVQKQSELAINKITNEIDAFRQPEVENLMTFEILSLVDSYQRTVIERISPKLAQSEVNEVSNSICNQQLQLQPLYAMSTNGSFIINNAYGNLRAVAEDLLYYYPVLRKTLPVLCLNDLDATNVSTAIHEWESVVATRELEDPTNQIPLQRLHACNHNLIGNLYLMDYQNQGSTNQDELVLAERHFRAATTSLTTFARPHNGLGAIELFRLEAKIRDTSITSNEIEGLVGQGDVEFQKALRDTSKTPRTISLIYNNRTVLNYDWIVAMNRAAINWISISNAVEKHFQKAETSIQCAESQADPSPGIDFTHIELDCLKYMVKFEENPPMQAKMAASFKSNEEQEFLDRIREWHNESGRTQRPRYIIQDSPMRFLNAVDTNFTTAVVQALQ